MEEVQALSRVAGDGAGGGKEEKKAMGTWTMSRTKEVLKVSSSCMVLSWMTSNRDPFLQCSHMARTRSW